MPIKTSPASVDLYGTFRLPKSFDCFALDQKSTNDNQQFLKDSSTTCLSIGLSILPNLEYSWYIRKNYKNQVFLEIIVRDVPVAWECVAKTFIHEKHIEIRSALQSIVSDEDYRNYLSNKELIDNAIQLINSDIEENVSLGQIFLKPLGFPKSKLHLLKYYYNVAS